MSLSREQEVEICLFGNRDALIVAHLPLAHKFARRYARPNEARYDDYLQAGCEGLMDAAERFDVALGYRFLTYAGHYVRAHMQREHHKSARVIEVPRSDKLRRGLKLIRTGEAKGPEDLETLLNARPKTAAFIWAVRAQGDVEIDAESSWCVERTTAEDLLSHEERKAIAIRDVQAALARLPERQRIVAERRWMADDTLESIAADLGVSRQAVHQTETRVREQLQRDLAETWRVVNGMERSAHRSAA